MTLVSEGGNDDDPRDPGGRTSRGITQNEWNNWRASHPGLPADVWQAPQEQVEAIYWLNYWNALACDQLPAGVDYCVFDYGVNSGNSRAAVALQQFVGTTVDGEIGPLTIAAAAKADPASLVGKICDQRLAFLKGLGTWRTFGNGWTRRVEGVRRQATAMIGAPTAPAETLPSTPVADPPWLVEARKYAQQGFRWASGNPPDQVKGVAQSHRNELTKHSGARPILRWARSGWVLGLVWRICRRNAGGGRSASGVLRARLKPIGSPGRRHGMFTGRKSTSKTASCRNPVTSCGLLGIAAVST